MESFRNKINALESRLAKKHEMNDLKKDKIAKRQKYGKIIASISQKACLSCTNNLTDQLKNLNSNE